MWKNLEILKESDATYGLNKVQREMLQELGSKIWKWKYKIYPYWIWAGIKKSPPRPTLGQ